MNKDLRLAVQRSRANRWGREFPYRYGEDELASRRTFLRFTVYTSGVIFGSTGVLAALNAVTPLARGEERVIEGASQVPVGGALYFNYPGPDDQAVLLRREEGFVAYGMKCTHLSCAVYHQPEHDRLYCPCHEGVFNPATGEPTAGPPRRRLPQIELRREGDNLIAVREVR